MLGKEFVIRPYMYVHGKWFSAVLDDILRVEQWVDWNETTLIKLFFSLDCGAIDKIKMMLNPTLTTITLTPNLALSPIFCKIFESCLAQVPRLCLTWIQSNIRVAGFIEPPVSPFTQDQGYCIGYSLKLRKPVHIYGLYPVHTGSDPRLRLAGSLWY